MKKKYFLLRTESLGTGYIQSNSLKLTPLTVSMTGPVPLEFADQARPEWAGRNRRHSCTALDHPRPFPSQPPGYGLPRQHRSA